MVLANSKTHIEPLDTFHDAGALDLDILLKGTIVTWIQVTAPWKQHFRKLNYPKILLPWSCESQMLQFDVFKKEENQNKHERFH